LEIGFALGTSAIIILNEICKFSLRKNYDIIDPNQSLQWKNLGKKNVDNFLQNINKKVNFVVHEEYSADCLPKLKKKYDISFIDGSHDYKIVIQDIYYSDKLLVKNGLIIIDDVLHDGVKKAIIEFAKTYKNYKKISIYNDNFIHDKILYNKQAQKRSFDNPNSMFCFQKMY
jgi:predicted O-methyltransferase YrrM